MLDTEKEPFMFQGLHFIAWDFKGKQFVNISLYFPGNGAGTNGK